MTNRAQPAALAALAALGAAAFAVFPTGDPLAPPTSATALVHWWEADSPAAAVTAARLITVVGCSYVAAVATLYAAADVFRLRWLRSVALAAASPTLRRRLSRGVLVATMAASPAGAGAQTGTGDAPVVLVDLGPAASAEALPSAPESIVLTDLGTTDTVTTAPARQTNAPGSLGAMTGPDDPPAPADTWLVEPGDHLWAIARATLTGAGRPTDDASVTAHWVELIAANASLLGADPDLIHPGQVLRLPPLTQG